MTDTVSGRRLVPLEIEDPPRKDTLIAQLWGLWSRVPAAKDVNWWYPVQLASTAASKALSYLPDDTPDLVQRGHSYDDVTAIRNLQRRGSFLGTTAIHVWVKHVKRTCRVDMEWIEEPSVSDGLGNLENIVFDKMGSLQPCVKFVSIPIIIQGLVEKHLVHVLVERRGKRLPLVEHFDPFGFEPEKDAKAVFSAVQSCFDRTEPFIHKTTLQLDRHNCGVACAWHLYQRVVCEVPPDKIAALKPDFEAFRKEMVLKLTDERIPQSRTEARS